MLCATKVYNGLLWHLREEFKITGKTKVTRQHLNAILKTLPKAKEYYSLSVQATRDEVIQAYRSFFAVRKIEKPNTRCLNSDARRNTRFFGTLTDTGSAWTVTGLL
jgi:transposase